NGRKLSARALDMDALTGLVNRLTERRVVWKDVHSRGIPVSESFYGSFTVSAAAASDVVNSILGRTEQLTPNVIIHPIGVPVVDGYYVQVEVTAAERED